MYRVADALLIDGSLKGRKISGIFWNNKFDSEPKLTTTSIIERCPRRFTFPYEYSTLQCALTIPQGVLELGENAREMSRFEHYRTFLYP